jgi:hypothetical protein
MRNGTLPNGSEQDLYFPDDHPTCPGYFKGMSNILAERGFTEEAKLNSQCPNFKCADPNTSCCCRRILFNQPDFQSQKAALIELVESHGHIAFFYPKFHCETNFIEQNWGASKYRYRILPLTENIEQMEQNVKECLDAVPLAQMRRYDALSCYFQCINSII